MPNTTPRQHSFITSLVNERDEYMVIGLYASLTGYNADTRGRVIENARSLTTRRASQFIDSLIALPRQAPAGRAPAPAPVEVPEGVHVTHEGVFRVVSSRSSGRRYAKRLVLPAHSGHNGRFVYAPGIVQKLNPSTLITRDQALSLGAEWGICVRCGRCLTDPTSVADGIGPVCWRAMFGETRGERRARERANVEDVEAAMHRMEAEGDRAQSAREAQACQEADLMWSGQVAR